MFLLFHSIFLLLPYSIISTSCPTCPPNGIWSNWATSEKCATLCGACSTVNRVRTCISEASGCPCIGSKTSKSACNTASCALPTSLPSSQCCSGTSKLVDSQYHCGVIEPEYKLDCCPIGGYWSTWTTFVKTVDTTEWRRSRTCLSNNHGCMCTGNEEDVVDECPCVAPTSFTNIDPVCSAAFPDYATWIPFNFTRPQFVIRPSLCEMYITLESTNKLANFVFDAEGRTRGIILWKGTNGNCNKIDFHPAGAVEYTGVTTYRSFQCDLQTLRYYGHTATDIAQISQFYSSV